MNAVVSLSASEDALSAALQAFVEAKRLEDQAKKRRLEAEERVLALVPPKEEGSQTIQVGDFHLTVTGALNYKCGDLQALDKACADARFGPNLVPIKTKVELDATGCKWLRQNEPSLWDVVAKHVTVSPAKAAMKVSV